MWEIGTKVMIKHNSEFYHQAPNLVGRIIGNGNLPGWQRVEFIIDGQPYTNSYRADEELTRTFGRPGGIDLIPVIPKNLKITIRRKNETI